MIKWLIWLGISLIPAIIVIIGDYSVQVLAAIYFILIIGVIVGWGLYEKFRKKSPEEV